MTGKSYLTCNQLWIWFFHVLIILISVYKRIFAEAQKCVCVCVGACMGEKKGKMYALTCWFYQLDYRSTW